VRYVGVASSHALAWATTGITRHLEPLERSSADDGALSLLVELGLNCDPPGRRREARRGHAQPLATWGFKFAVSRPGARLPRAICLPAAAGAWLGAPGASGATMQAAEPACGLVRLHLSRRKSPPEPRQAQVLPLPVNGAPAFSKKID
jgi:hypothetical protein